MRISTRPGRLSWNDCIDRPLGDAMGERVTDKSEQQELERKQADKS
jgi:hypothetical protein